MFYEELPISVEICKGSPREVIKNAKDASYQSPVTGSIMYFDVKKQTPKKFDNLMALIPDNIFVGFNDDLPGMIGSKLPPRIDDLTLKLKIAALKTIYAHNIRISSMNEVE